MKEYIVNLTNNLIGTYRFDRMFQNMKTAKEISVEVHDDWKEEFVRLVTLTLSTDIGVNEMSPETLGKIVCSMEGGELPCYQPAEYFGKPDQYLRNIVSSMLAWSIRYRLDGDALKRHDKIPPYPRRLEKVDADMNPLSGRFGP